MGDGVLTNSEQNKQLERKQKSKKQNKKKEKKPKNLQVQEQ
jgi:hypothetical protein